jgi:intron-binding protein aquarius
VFRYTPAQVEALRSGMNKGLTMIVGPPGTGKTDVAVQIICNLYHNYPTQKILLVAHSNTALNDLFEKIMQVSTNDSGVLFSTTFSLDSLLLTVFTVLVIIIIIIKI